MRVDTAIYLRWMSRRTAITCSLLLIVIGGIVSLNTFQGPMINRNVLAATSEPMLGTPGGPPETIKTTQPIVCDSNLLIDRMALTVMTGTTRCLSTFSTQLVTSLRCIREPILLSTLNSTLGKHQIYDALRDCDPQVMNESADLEMYRKQKKMMATGDELSVGSVDDAGTPSAEKQLEKYMPLHAIERAWALQPDRDWYIFIGSSVWLSARSVQSALSNYNPQIKLWFGSFATESTGEVDVFDNTFILSSAAVRAIAVDHTGLGRRWDERISALKDARTVLAVALGEELDIRVKDRAVLLDHEKPALISFGMATWCREVMSLGGLDSRQFDTMYQLQMKSHDQRVSFRDLYHQEAPQGVPFKLEDWDNRAEDHTYLLNIVNNDANTIKGQWEPNNLVDPHSTFQNCELACIQNRECFQFSFVVTILELTNTSGECFLSSVFRIGETRKPEIWGAESENGKGWTSGWRSDRIARWVADNARCDDET